VEYGTWHVRFCELTGGAEFLIPYYSEAHSGQARMRCRGARASSRGAPRFCSGYSVWGMRGHGVKEQCVRGHFKKMAPRCPNPYIEPSVAVVAYGLALVAISGATAVNSQ
jgi:hypothetical protein